MMMMMMMMLMMMATMTLLMKNSSYQHSECGADKIVSMPSSTLPMNVESLEI